MKLFIRHTVVELVRINEDYQLSETTVDLEGWQTEKKVQKMFKDSKIKSLVQKEDEVNVSLETLLSYKVQETQTDVCTEF